MKPKIYSVELIGNGSLSMMAKPVSGEWIDDEFKSIALEGINTIVSLLEKSESYDVGLQNEEAFVKKYGMEFYEFPIKDRGIPQSKEQFRTFSKALYIAADSGKNIVVHCRAGIGRAGLLAAGVLLHCKFDAIDAFDHIAKKRGIAVPDTETQKDWLIKNQDFIVGKQHS